MIDFNEISNTGIALITFFITLTALIIASAIFVARMPSDAAKQNKIIKNLDRIAPLPDEAKWECRHGVPCLMININKGGQTPKWEEMFSFNVYPSDTTGKEWAEIFEDRAKKIRDEYFATEGFTKVPEFPLPEGKWEVSHTLGDSKANVNGHQIVAGRTGDYRDTISAMVLASAKLIEESQKNAKSDEQKRVLGDVLVDDVKGDDEDEKPEYIMYG